jgi:hypothetical protein
VAQGLGFARVQERMWLRVHAGDRRWRCRECAVGGGDEVECGRRMAARLCAGGDAMRERRRGCKRRRREGGGVMAAV